ncbi:MAG: hypothetical protein U1A27_12225 [Phycisphaerae bacterium]
MLLLMGLAAISQCGSGCGVGTGALPDLIINLLASGGAVGSTGRLRIELSNPVARDTTISLTSSDTAVATVASSVTVPAGVNTIEVPYNAVAPGSSNFTATLGGSSMTASGRVATSVQLSGFSASSTLQVSAVGTVTVSTNILVPTATTVTLTQSNSVVTTIPSSIVVPAFSNSGSGTVTGVAVGGTTLTATLGSVSLSTQVFVVATPFITSVSSFSSKFQVGASATIFLSLSALAAADAPVSISNSAPTMLSVPSTATVANGASSTFAPFVALAPGVATVTFNVFGQSRGTTIEVTNIAVIAGAAASPTPRVNGAGAFFVQLDTQVAADTVVTLTQTNPAALSMPGTLVIPANRTQGSVGITGLASTPTTITATLGGSTATTTITPGP